MASRAERDLALMLASFQNLGPALKRMKQEQMAKELLGEDLDTYKLRTAVEDNDLDRQVKRAQLKRALERGQSGPGYVQTEYGLMTPYQAAQIKNRGRDAITYDTPYGPMSPSQAAEYELKKRALDEKNPDLSEEESDPVIAAIDAEIAKVRGEIGKGNKRPGIDWIEDKIAEYLPAISGNSSHPYEKKLAELQERRGKLGGTNLSVEPNAAPYAEQVRPKVADAPAAKKDYPIGTKARKGDQWFVMTEGGWKPAVP